MSSSLREQLAAVRAKRGELTPPVLLDEARDPEHPLHPRFEWDDAIAAEKHRLGQAHELIQSVRITYAAKEGPVSIRAFQAIRRPSGWVYEPSEEVARDPVDAQIVLREMEREWRQLYARYERWPEFVALVREDIGEQAA